MPDSADTADTRPVWLTREQRDAIENMLEAFFDLNHVGNVVEAWDAAPADAAEAVRAAWLSVLHISNPDLVTETVLRALGMRDA